MHDAHRLPLHVPDDPDSVPVEWRLWLNGQQHHPPTIAPTSADNAALHRLEDLVADEQQPAEQSSLPTAELGAVNPAWEAARIESARVASDADGGAARQYNPQPKAYQPESWSAVPTDADRRAARRRAADERASAREKG